MVESVGAGNDFEERVKGSFRVHLSQEPSQKKPTFFLHKGGLDLPMGGQGPSIRGSRRHCQGY